ncbi:uncharacterized protein AMSG_02652 [Thecamonas trahens ATCC 50062]|uniref:Guanylate cyclase domain-containing protein n=1 Tax=Thecamonas trahens ATCC 50062 TaxID=461836 RepID=A0A0L0D620_THETB|nr:hypothetical protein AMSG_02652 [Thecamonas trahens ATCC 50062]KNC47630.1 hypothetical protein AMSG_02652 [Thecamonas trahens ATCC 50062]|eukprot:XP_013759550.1 hypothetical protein AMSG_02652 [Thecamonas trahens ATCC 50062]
MCFGDNSTCTGCDGVPNSGAVPDVCGECDGDGSSCLGCDGVPIPLGGAHFDACGVCGGSAVGSCIATCDNSSAVPVVFDCAGVCNGNATIDECGVCVGGTTGRPPRMHLDACGDCFARCEGCGTQTTDVCGVCNGDGSSCAGCDGLGGIVDACGVCAGNGSSCVISCDETIAPDAAVDCAGSTGLPLSAFIDSCGDCYGGDARKDSCGVCGGGNVDRDDCAVCFGGNAAKDACGVCFGGGRFADVCGVCYGNATSCAGCDAVPNSGVVLDACGVCGGAGLCVTARTTTPGVRDPVVVAITASSFGACIVLATVFGLCLRLRKRRAHAAYLAHKMAAEEALAPSGHLAVFISDVQSSTYLWEAYPEAMVTAIDAHNDVFRHVLGRFGGYEVRTEGDSFVVVFQQPQAAVAAAVTLQTELMAVDWPAPILGDNRVVSNDGPDTVWRGLRVRIGIAMAEPTRVFVERTQRFTYEGPDMLDAQSVGDAGSGGQVVVDAATVAACAGSSLTFTRLGRYSCGSTRGHLALREYELYEADIPGLSARRGCSPNLRGMSRIMRDVGAKSSSMSMSSSALSSSSAPTTARDRSHSDLAPGAASADPLARFNQLEIEISSDLVPAPYSQISPTAAGSSLDRPYSGAMIARHRRKSKYSSLLTPRSPNAPPTPRAKSADDLGPSALYPYASGESSELAVSQLLVDASSSCGEVDTLSRSDSRPRGPAHQSLRWPALPSTGPRLI